MNNKGPRDSASQDEELIEAVYAQLRSLASKMLGPGQQNRNIAATSLVNAAWLRMEKNPSLQGYDSRAFAALCATMVRRELVDRLRREHLRAHPTAGQRLSVRLLDDTSSSSVDVLELHDALTKFASIHERAARVVELRFFGGMTLKEIGAELCVSERTINTEWTTGRAWLFHELGGSA